MWVEELRKNSISYNGMCISIVYNKLVGFIAFKVRIYPKWTVYSVLYPLQNSKNTRLLVSKRSHRHILQSQIERLSTRSVGDSYS